MGFNRDAARIAWISWPQTQVMAMLLAGGCAGLVFLHLWCDQLERLVFGQQRQCRVRFRVVALMEAYRLPRLPASPFSTLPTS